MFSRKFVKELVNQFLLKKFPELFPKLKTRAIVKEIVDGTEDGILKIMAEEIH